MSSASEVLGLALPLHTVGAEEVVLEMTVRGEPALLQGSQQDQGVVQPNDPGVPVSEAEPRAEEGAGCLRAGIRPTGRVRK